jgi:ATP-dependent Lhr-like helicase
LTSKAREVFGDVHTVIVDEIHNLARSKRGVHLALTLERLERLTRRSPQRIGLSATQRPLEEIARFLGGQDAQSVPRPVTIVDVGGRKQMDVKVVCVAPDLTSLPDQSVWSLVFPEVYSLIQRHRTTLVFTNNRRLAERVAARLNELAEEELALAYHGSMSPEARRDMEDRLKKGKIRCLVSTSALELGIDIGSIDLVVQLQSPKGVAAALQRVGRSGHLVSATSQGRLFPTFRDDLVETAVIAKAMYDGWVERTRVPKDALDVLAQQIVASVAMDDWNVEALYQLMRRAYPYQNLTRNVFLSVLCMVAGRYGEGEFRNLRARISWDPQNDVLRKLPGSQSLAVTSGGTIPDRGLFAAYLESGKRIGELDEEFVFESRVGEVFLLGSTSWRIQEIQTDRVIVREAFGEPAKMPFWKGEGIGRDYELSLKVGEFHREAGKRLQDPDVRLWLERTYSLDSRSAWNIVSFLESQRAATRVIPDDRNILAEIFRDEIGNPRIAIHSVFGRSVNDLLALVLGQRLRDVLRVNVQYQQQDNGILFEVPDSADVEPDAIRKILASLRTEHLRDWVVDEIARSPLFVAAFRENAMRSLLLPRNKPGQRTPLWMQRLRAGDFFEITKKYDDFPVIVETMRDCLHDRMDFDSFHNLVADIESERISIHATRTDVPSPFSASLLFGFIGVYMYEDDRPRAEWHSQLLQVNRSLLDEVLDPAARRELVEPQAVEQVEERLGLLGESRRARSPEELAELLYQLGDLSDEEMSQRSENPAFSETLKHQGRIVAFGERWILSEERALYRATDLDSRKILRRRFLQTHVPVPASVLSRRFSFDVEPALDALRAEGSAITGKFVSDVDEWSHPSSLEQVYRRTLSILRSQTQPSSLAQFTRFLTDWQGRTGPTGSLEDVLEQLEGYPAPPEVWESEILGERVTGYSVSSLEKLMSRGKVFAMGAGKGKVRLLQRGHGWLFEADPEEISASARLLAGFLEEHGASFFEDFRESLDLPLASLVDSLAELFWAGVVTNDVFGEVSRLRRTAMGHEETIQDRSQKMRKFRRTWKNLPGWTGRWALIGSKGYLGQTGTPVERVDAIVRIVLRRYGVVTREWFSREQLPVSWAVAARALERLEWRGEVRRGVFVDQISGVQYALPDAVEALRSTRIVTSDDSLRMNACDPASPYGGGIPSEIPISRVPSLFVRLDAGRPVSVERN